MWTRCPDPHQLAAYADGRLNDVSRRTIAAHLAHCDRCLDALALVTRLEAVDDRPAVAAGLLARARALGRRESRSPLVRWAPMLASAALVVIVAGLVVQERIGAPLSPKTGSRTSDPAREVRTGSEPLATPIIVAPADESVVPAMPVRIEWSAVPGAVFYEVRIAAEDGALVWDGRASGDSTLLMADAGVAPGRRYYVTVTAQAAGDRRVRSRAVGFQIGRRP